MNLRAVLAALADLAPAGGGATRRVRVPLLSEPVRLERARREYRVVPAGDMEVTPLLKYRETSAPAHVYETPASVAELDGEAPLSPLPLNPAQQEVVRPGAAAGRAGRRLLEAFPSRWPDDPVRAAPALSEASGPAGGNR